MGSQQVDTWAWSRVSKALHPRNVCGWKRGHIPPKFILNLIEKNCKRNTKELYRQQFQIQTGFGEFQFNEVQLFTEQHFEAQTVSPPRSNLFTSISSRKKPHSRFKMHEVLSCTQRCFYVWDAKKFFYFLKNLILFPLCELLSRPLSIQPSPFYDYYVIYSHTEHIHFFREIFDYNCMIIILWAQFRRAHSF